MIPNIDPKLMKAAMKKMGIKQEEIAADEVVIKTSSGNIVIRNPSVTKMTMGGRESFEITGDVSEEKLSEDDVKTVAEQADVDEDTARKALEKANGDLAEAILSLKQHE
ncbi:MAG: nascent polypeptide-associated complex protein [Nanoarchaeota archaeon]|nr:nascent polypeptide-associated complex protein [Nanoarchaeota archaeon]